MKYLGIEESAYIRGVFIATVGCSKCGGRLGYFTSAAGIHKFCPRCGHKLEKAQLSFKAVELVKILNERRSMIHLTQSSQSTQTKGE